MLHLLTKISQLGTTATKDSLTTKVSMATMTTPNTAKSSIPTTTIKTTKEKGRCIWIENYKVIIDAKEC